jgi:hypothetical protein
MFHKGIYGTGGTVPHILTVSINGGGEQLHPLDTLLPTAKVPTIIGWSQS